MKATRAEPSGPDRWDLTRFQSPIIAWAVLATAIAFTAAAWYVSRQAVQESAEQRFEFQTHQLEVAIRDRVIVNEQVLWGGVGLFEASDEVTREEWHQYVTALDIDEHWPGMQGLGFAIPLEPNELDSHIASIRAEGFPDYEVRPTDPRSEYTSIVFLEPFDERNQRAFGFDMWSNAIRREAMSEARDTGQAATSGVITLVQETSSDVQQGFLTYVPLYNQDVTQQPPEVRRSSLRGWVYAAFRMGDLMDEIPASELDHITYEIFDGRVATEDTLLFDSNDNFDGPALTDDTAFRRTALISLQGREWSIAFQSGPGFLTGNETWQPTLIAVAGLIIDILLFYVIASLGFMQRRARSLAEGMTSELRATKEDLERRSLELQDHADQLRQSNVELEQFAYVAAHDLQEPLRNLGSYAALLSDKYETELGDEGKRWLGYISSSSQRMSNLLRALLGYASIDTEIEPLAPVSLEHALTNALGDLAEAITAAEIVISREPLPVVEGDQIQLDRLLQNLLSNAIKYRSDAPNRRIWISLVDSGDQWRINIRDNGIGIKAEYHDRIFEIFRRVGSRSKYEGTGIGLAVCRKIVSRHGGDIGVDSIPGHGSEFWFTMPRLQNQPNIEGSPIKALEKV